jgi:hypothetical protein
MVGRPGYPWITWADGEVHRIAAGTDFTCSIKSMRGQLHARAAWLGMGMVIWERRPGVLLFLFVDSRADDLPDGYGGV